MINHARSYFINQKIDDSVLGSELFDPEFSPVKLPWYLNSVRTVFFGTAPDGYMLNYRAAQMVRLWHASELLEHVLRRDSRVTYDPQADIYADSRLFWPSSKVVGAGSVQLAGFDSSPDAHGRIRITWRLDLTTAENVRVTYSSGQTWNVAVEDSPVRQLTLPGTNYRVTLTDFSATDHTVITLLQRPDSSIEQLLQRLGYLPEETTSQLFGVNTKYYGVLEIATARDLWLTGREPTLRLGAAALALAIATEESK